MLIARLIADAEQVETRLDRALSALSGAGFSIMSSGSLGSDREIVELSVDGGSPEALRAIVETEMSPHAGLIARDAVQFPKLFVSDMDSTIIGQECIDELADFAGLKDHVAAITERAMQGEIDFETALRDRVALLKDLDESAISQCLTDRIHPTEGARALVQTLRAGGCRTALVTGGFHHFADVVAEGVGFERVVGNRLGVEGGKLTGGLVGPIADSATKLAVLREESARLHGGAILAAGDGANDIPMLEAATYGFAFKAKAKARAAASCWIDEGDLTAILRLLGIPQSDWVE
ncbi:MAG: phosphoserine phosphatase SerB [Pontixanthobacter sp.]